MYGSSDLSCSSALAVGSWSKFGFFVSGLTKNALSCEPSAAAKAVSRSAVLSSGSAIGYFIPSASWSFFASVRSSSKVVGGVRPFLSNRSLR